MFENDEGWVCAIPEGIRVRDYTNLTLKMLKSCNFWVSPEQYTTAHYWKSPMKFTISNKTCPDMTSRYGRIDFKLIVISENLFFITKDMKHNLKEDANEIREFMKELIEFLVDKRARHLASAPCKGPASLMSLTSVFSGDPFKHLKLCNGFRPRGSPKNVALIAELEETIKDKNKKQKMRKEIQNLIHTDLIDFFSNREKLENMKNVSESMTESVLSPDDVSPDGVSPDGVSPDGVSPDDAHVEFVDPASEPAGPELPPIPNNIPTINLEDLDSSPASEEFELIKAPQEENKLEINKTCVMF